MDRFLEQILARLSSWACDGIETLVLGTQVAAILLAAWLVMRVVRRLLARRALAYALPPTLVVPSRRVIAMLWPL